MNFSTQRTATLIGSLSIFMWGLLALLTTLVEAVPPFLLLALSFGIATASISVKWIIRRENIKLHLQQPLGAWLLSTTGLFGYHYFYFMALRHAPPVEASLIAYMWPVLIVLFSASFPEEKLRWNCLAGALLGLGGVVLLITDGKGIVELRTENILGYIMAVCCALTWSLYSVFNKCFRNVPTDTVGGFCAVVSVLAWIAHVLFENTVWPATIGEWLAIVGLGTLPIGLAFFTWDYGTKHGDIQALGVLSYIAPLLSTLLLIVFEKGEATFIVGGATLLISGGAVLAAHKTLFKAARSGPNGNK
ncbi:MAG: EamA family transporter [Rhodospirillaceae bacterium TMED8]|nr:EamA family transporter [Magnetovibrio sp.]OUT49863.1 MAG: EamA family transporter [Rhodospirillaceae bacterium TMED8]|tara:strand:- start:380 stop:1291 length:912 start_codon:yes stop_codon:yes gene_type:complete